MALDALFYAVYSVVWVVDVENCGQISHIICKYSFVFQIISF